MIDKAVILAAGMGTRIATSPALAGTPKPLLPLDDQGLTFLDWHVRSLAAHGAREIFIVGSQASYGRELASAKTIPVIWLLNDFPGDRSGSGHSTHIAFRSSHDILDGRGRVVLMDADVVYDPTLLSALGERRGKSKTLVCSRFRETHEEVMVFASEDRPVVHGKGLLGSPLVRGLRCAGEATGLLLLEPADHALWLAAADWCMAYSTAKTRSEHEDITQRVMAIGALEMVTFDDDARFMECDTPDEYALARASMVPRWRPSLP